MARLKIFYKKVVIKKLQKELQISNVMAVPRIIKITLNMGLGADVKKDKKNIEYAIDDLEKISGQKPVITKSKKSIAGFKIRDGWPIGCKVTLRNNRMYEFLDRLINIAIPRIRDFRGLKITSFDKNGNYNMGMHEQISFPEIEYDQVKYIRGFNISITINAKNNEFSKSLLKAFSFPLQNKE